MNRGNQQDQVNRDILNIQDNHNSRDSQDNRGNHIIHRDVPDVHRVNRHNLDNRKDHMNQDNHEVTRHSIIVVPIKEHVFVFKVKGVYHHTVIYLIVFLKKSSNKGGKIKIKHSSFRRRQPAR